MSLETMNAALQTAAQIKENIKTIEENELVKLNELSARKEELMQQLNDTIEQKKTVTTPDELTAVVTIENELLAQLKGISQLEENIKRIKEDDLFLQVDELVKQYQTARKALQKAELDKLSTVSLKELRTAVETFKSYSQDIGRISSLFTSKISKYKRYSGWNTAPYQLNHNIYVLNDGTAFHLSGAYYFPTKLDSLLKSIQKYEHMNGVSVLQ